MKTFSFAAAGLFAATASATVLGPGSAPRCFVTADGQTRVEFTSKYHPSFKCQHSGNSCSCTAHPVNFHSTCVRL